MNSKDLFILYEQNHSINSFLIKLILNEKDIPFKTNTITFDKLPKHVKETAYEKRFPIIQDRDLVLNDTQQIIDYIENRYPSPKLYPFMPDEKAQYNSICGKLKDELLAEIENLIFERTTEGIKRLLECFTELNSIFNESRYFLSQEYSILDCYIVSALHFNDTYNFADLSKNKLLISYKTDCFKRDNYIKTNKYF